MKAQLHRWRQSKDAAEIIKHCQEICYGTKCFDTDYLKITVCIDAEMGFTRDILITLKTGEIVFAHRTYRRMTFYREDLQVFRRGDRWESYLKELHALRLEDFKKNPNHPMHAFEDIVENENN